MPRLILVNGIPGSGKSALGRRYLDDRQLALALDIDAIRSMLGDPLGEPTTSGQAARDLARSMADTHLRAGHDVLVSQFLGRLEFVEVLERLTVAIGVPFVEVVLDTGIEEAAERLVQRAGDRSRPEHGDAVELLQAAGGPGALVGMYARLEEVVLARPDTHRVSVVDGDLEQTYQAFLQVLQGV